MAADLDGAETMLSAARQRGVPLMVNWPTVWRPALRYGLTLAIEGVVGDPIQVSHRGGHAGPREFGCSPQFSEWLYDPKRNGGGALVDYCGYGALALPAGAGPARRGDGGRLAAAQARPHRRGQRGGGALLPARARAAGGQLDADWRRAGLRDDRLRRSRHAAGPPAADDARGRAGGARSGAADHPGQQQPDAGTAAATRRRAGRADLLPLADSRRPRSHRPVRGRHRPRRAGSDRGGASRPVRAAAASGFRWNARSSPGRRPGWRCRPRRATGWPP